jgi:small nuclear ribonucleoprotein (snRNP)-like protein
MDKRLTISLQGGRKVSGVLRGFDIFLNLVVDDAVEESGPNVTAPPTKNPLGQIVCDIRIWFTVAVTDVNFTPRSFGETA